MKKCDALSALKKLIRKRYDLIANSKGKASVDEILAIARHVSAHVKRPYLDHGELLYDEDGLPK